MAKDLIIIGNIADCSFTEDITHQFDQQEDYSDLISLKSFKNTEFCPRFISGEEDLNDIGYKLKNKRILIVSADSGHYSRNELAMYNLLISRAAKDNGAAWVGLLEPDLFYSAQDRGPRPEQGCTPYQRDMADCKKFDGQPFSARLYADLLKEAGIDAVYTIHTNSFSVKSMFTDRMSGHFHNLQPADLYSNYIKNSDIVDPDNLILCAPDKGAVDFVKKVHAELKMPKVPVIILDKERKDEQTVEIEVSSESGPELKTIAGKDVVVIDDMVRTGNTIVQSCQLLKKANPRKIVFFVTHFYSSPEGRIKLNDPCIDEIITTNTIPNILNKDEQGRLRKKMVVLKIGRWTAYHLIKTLNPSSEIKASGPLYIEEMSSKHPRFKGNLGPLFSSM
ncbi:MAG: ribose-phosphate pyrophosphokinase [Spirochaetales bacterium]|nr:ribose-phosphate pyrophosphokinase [Spirochaetales bacterium]